MRVQTCERIAAAARLHRIDDALHLVAQYALHIEHRTEGDRAVAAHARCGAVLFDIATAHERQCAIVDAGAVFKTQRRATTAAAATPDVRILWRFAVNLRRNIFGEPRGFDTGAVTVQGGIETGLLDDGVADMTG